jgi:hypothetical protein
LYESGAGQAPFLPLSFLFSGGSLSAGISPRHRDRAWLSMRDTFTTKRIKQINVAGQLVYTLKVRREIIPQLPV